MNRQELESAIIQLQRLLYDENCAEKDLQSWLESNQVVFDSWGYTRIEPHPELKLENGKKLIPDFMAQRIDGLWDVIELKRPDTQMLKDPGRRTTFYANISSYIAQCIEYSDYFNEKSARDEFFKTYESEIQEHPDVLLISGRNAGLDRLKVHKLLSRQIPHVFHQTYDDIFNHLQVQRSKIYGLSKPEKGFSLHTILVLDEPSEQVGSYILDIGSDLEKNRIVLRTGLTGEFVLSVFDNNGIEHRATISQGEETFKYGQAVYLIIDVCAGSDPVIIMEINGQYVSEQSLKGLSLNLYNDPIPIVLGSDQTGVEPSFMLFGGLLIRSPTLSFSEKIQLKEWYLSKYEKVLSNPGKRPTGLEIRGNQYMYTRGHVRLSKAKGTMATQDLVQEDLGKRPRFRVSPDDPER